MTKIFIDNHTKEMVNNAAKIQGVKKQLYNSILKDAVKTMKENNPHIPLRRLKSYFQSIVTIAKSKIAFKSIAEQSNIYTDEITPCLSNNFLSPLTRNLKIGIINRNKD